jgi:hypothetical protein
VLEEYWELEVRENDIYDYENLEKILFSDIDKFNVNLSWFFLSKSQIMLQKDEVYAYFKETNK